MKATAQRSPWFSLVAAASAYVLASAVRSVIVPEQIHSSLGQVLDVSALYLVTLMPGFLVGLSRIQRFLTVGFLAGCVGEILRQLLGILMEALSVPDGISVTPPPASMYIGFLLTSVPSGILAMAGASLGAVLAARRLRGQP